ncbi:dienelactone hydrolase [Rhizobium leguminosarum]|uniref:Dienelactone hydrolase n=1 Tax=Rhizobium leguminosarum TaxID=384 RepID=A0AAE2MG77_RHILE|nr:MULTISPECIES: dienelactone hydrolase family protein [Rhizobium]MBB4288858.1 dienelactone hydrolase [Rhizobium leguminosarum]MBB4295048.1 dienelactone hydrolase [Rhizobium leguminosarum]MBB4306442.1 dienelactone hydrolase [Rhizobium leguminosarum]MBB4417978.1 dienelactone hydrolase [Rhizobium leguminosarum]MBB4432823.1 dienelactone hydrolase [Rhizobium esperanzae]
MKTTVYGLFLCLAAFLAVTLAGNPADADELVRFESAPVKLSPFRISKAREQGEILSQPQGTPLLGYLSRPEGDGPFPAVVLLHGCEGMRLSIKELWPQRLVAWGYAVLVVDSFTTRNIQDTCQTTLPDRVFDAYGALNFLSKQNFVDIRRVALMGFSAGGTATLEGTKIEGNEQLMDHKFRAAVAYYPVCAASQGDATVPILILSGDRDNWSPAERCRQRLARLSDDSPPIELNIYKGTYHDFDAPEFKVGRRVLGHIEKYNPDVAEKSIRSVRLFLRKYLSN